MAGTYEDVRTIQMTPPAMPVRTMPPPVRNRSISRQQPMGSRIIPKSLVVPVVDSSCPARPAAAVFLGLFAIQGRVASGQLGDGEHFLFTVGERLAARAGINLSARRLDQVHHLGATRTALLFHGASPLRGSAASRVVVLID